MSSLLRVKKLIIPVESIEEILSRSDQWIVIGERGGAIVATLHLEKAAHVCRLGMFAVAPELQARGIGKRLLGEAERRARNSAARSCSSWSSPYAAS